MWNRYSVRRRSRRWRPEYRFESVITLDPTVDLPQVSQEFSYAVFLKVDVESLLGEAKVSSLETSVPVRKVYNF